jgi:glucokinase
MAGTGATTARTTVSGVAGPRVGLVIGVDIGGTNLRVAIAERSGTIAGRVSLELGDVREPASMIKLIRRCVDQIVQEHSLDAKTLCAIAVGVPGITDAARGVVIATSYLMGWIDVDLRNLLEDEFGIPAAVENDVNLAAVGEHHAGAAQGVSDFVFVAIGTGIGAGIVLNGQVHHGFNWTAGEVGYLLLPGLKEQPAERGKPGALEEIAGGEGIRTQWLSGCDLDQAPGSATADAAQITATRIMDRALAGEALAQDVLHRAARMLGYAIYNISLILDPPLFLLGGTVGLHPAILAATRAVLAERGARLMPRVIPSALGADAQLVGAIFRAIETADRHSPLAS